MDVRLYQALERIAEAFEEQNRQNAEWIVMQTKWRHKDREDDVGKQIVALHEQNAKRDASWIDEQRKILIDFLAREHDAYVEVAREEVRKKLQEEGTSL